MDKSFRNQKSPVPLTIYFIAGNRYEDALISSTPGGPWMDCTSIKQLSSIAYYIFPKQLLLKPLSRRAEIAFGIRGDVRELIVNP